MPCSPEFYRNVPRLYRKRQQPEFRPASSDDVDTSLVREPILTACELLPHFSPSKVNGAQERAQERLQQHYGPTFFTKVSSPGPPITHTVARETEHADQLLLAEAVITNEVVSCCVTKI